MVVSKTKGKSSTVRTAREISANSCEVERRNCEDEALERAVLNAASMGFGLANAHVHRARGKEHALPRTPGVLRRLLGVKFFDVLHPKAEKVGKLKSKGTK
jgi:hypothetical protein